MSRDHVHEAPPRQHYSTGRSKPIKPRMTVADATREAVRRWEGQPGSYPEIHGAVRGRRRDLPCRVGVLVFKMGGPAGGVFIVKGRGDTFVEAFADADRNSAHVTGRDL